MKQITRLLHEARAALRELRRPILALIERKGAAWSMDVHVEGAGADECSDHDTIEGAVDHLARQYPGEDMPVIIDDI